MTASPLPVQSHSILPNEQEATRESQSGSLSTRQNSSLGGVKGDDEPEVQTDQK